MNIKQLGIKRLLILLLIKSYLLGMVTIFSQPVHAALPNATLSFDPSSTTIAPSSGTTLKIKIQNAEHLAGFEFTISYNPSVIKINSSSDISLGSFLGSSGRSVSLLPSDINNTTGTALVGAYSTGTQSGPTGNGTLLSITFKAQNPGTSTLRLQNVLLSTSDDPPQTQPTSLNNGSITVSAQPTNTPTPRPTNTPTPRPTNTPTPTRIPTPTPTPECNLSLTPSSIQVCINSTQDLTATVTKGSVDKVQFSRSNSRISLSKSSDSSAPYTTSATGNSAGSVTLTAEGIINNQSYCSNTSSITVVDCVTLTPTPSPKPTSTPTPGISPTPTPTSSIIPSLTPTASPVPTATPTQTPGQTIGLSPVADAFVSAEFPSLNFGSASQLEVDGTPEKISYLTFDLPDYINIQVISSKLRIRISDQSEAGSLGSQNVKTVTETAWDESLITHNNQPPRGSQIAVNDGGVAGSFVEIPLPAASIAANMGQLYSIAIDSQDSDSLVFYSKERTVADQWPLLIFTYEVQGTPTPTPSPTPVTSPPPSPTPGGPTLTPTPSIVPTPTPVPGDANGDDKADLLDFVIYLFNQSKTVQNGRRDADFNEDTTVNGLDYVIWLMNYLSN